MTYINYTRGQRKEKGAKYFEIDALHIAIQRSRDSFLRAQETVQNKKGTKSKVQRAKNLLALAKREGLTIEKPYKICVENSPDGRKVFLVFGFLPSADAFLAPLRANYY